MGSMTNFNGEVGEGMFAEPYGGLVEEQIDPNNYIGSMTNFNGNVGEGTLYETDPYFFGSMTDFDGYVGEGEYQAEPWGIWTYVVGTFVVFSVALAIVRRQFNSVAKNTNIKKAIKNRFKKVVGDADNMGNGGDLRREQNDRFMDNERGQFQDVPLPGDGPKKEEKGFMGKIKSGLGFSGKKTPTADYNSLPEGEGHGPPDGDQKRLWTPSGPVLIDGAGNKVLKQHERVVRAELVEESKNDDEAPAKDMATDGATIRAVAQELDDIVIGEYK